MVFVPYHVSWDPCACCLCYWFIGICRCILRSLFRDFRHMDNSCFVFIGSHAVLVWFWSNIDSKVSIMFDVGETAQDLTGKAAASMVLKWWMRSCAWRRWLPRRSRSSRHWLSTRENHTRFASTDVRCSLWCTCESRSPGFQCIWALSSADSERYGSAR